MNAAAASPRPRPARSSLARRFRKERLAFLAATGIGLSVVLFVGFQRPLDHGAHPGVVIGYQPLATVYGLDPAGMHRFVTAVVVAYAVFALAAFFATRVVGRPGFWLVLAGTAVAIAVLLPTNPAGAQDVYHNIADARTFWVYGDNPAVTPPDAHPDDPLFKSVPAWPDTPSSYGPLWYALSGAPLPIAGDHLWANVIGQKLLTSAFLLAATALAMLTAGRIRPGSAALAGVLVGWNPLLLFETAGNAHNDIVMVAFALAAFYALARRWWLLVFPLLALAVLVKYVMLLLAPLLLLWLLLRADVPKWQVALSLVLGIAVGVLGYAPFYAGGALLDTLRGEGTRYLDSTGSMTVSMLMQHRGMDLSHAEVAMRRVLTAAFVAGFGLLLLRFRRNPSYSFLTTTCAAVAFLLLVTVKWWFWPWYLAWLMPIAALAPRRAMALLASTFSLTAMLMYAAYYWHVYGDWHATQQLVFKTVFVVPLGLAAAMVVYWLLRNAWGHLRPRAPVGARSASAAPSVEH